MKYFRKISWIRPAPTVHWLLIVITIVWSTTTNEWHVVILNNLFASLFTTLVFERMTRPSIILAVGGRRSARCRNENENKNRREDVLRLLARVNTIFNGLHFCIYISVMFITSGFHLLSFFTIRFIDFLHIFIKIKLIIFTFEKPGHCNRTRWHDGKFMIIYVNCCWCRMHAIYSCCLP